MHRLLRAGFAALCLSLLICAATAASGGGHPSTQLLRQAAHRLAQLAEHTDTVDQDAAVLLTVATSEMAALQQFYSQTCSLASPWTIANNWTNAAVSVCEWYGVECIDRGDGTRCVNAIRLRQNNLVGTLNATTLAALSC